VAELSKNLNILNKIQFIVIVKIPIVSHVIKKNMNPQDVNIWKNGPKEKRVIQKILNGSKLILSHVLGVRSLLKRIKDVCT